LPLALFRVWIGKGGLRDANVSIRFINNFKGVQIMYVHRPQYTEPITKAFQAVDKGDTEKALQIIEKMGLPEPEAELDVIIKFVDFMKNSK
jgi:hypothetical protein